MSALLQKKLRVSKTLISFVLLSTRVHTHTHPYTLLHVVLPNMAFPSLLTLIGPIDYDKLQQLYVSTQKQLDDLLSAKQLCVDNQHLLAMLRANLKQLEKELVFKSSYVLRRMEVVERCEKLHRAEEQTLCESLLAEIQSSRVFRNVSSTLPPLTITEYPCYPALEPVVAYEMKMLTELVALIDDEKVKSLAHFQQQVTDSASSVEKSLVQPPQQDNEDALPCLPTPCNATDLLVPLFASSLVNGSRSPVMEIDLQNKNVPIISVKDLQQERLIVISGNDNSSLSSEICNDVVLPRHVMCRIAHAHNAHVLATRHLNLNPATEEKGAPHSSSMTPSALLPRRQRTIGVTYFAQGIIPCQVMYSYLLDAGYKVYFGISTAEMETASASTTTSTSATVTSYYRIEWTYLS